MAYVAGNITVVKVAANGQRYYGESEHCVDAVKHFCHASHASGWPKGKQVKGNVGILPGTIIASFTTSNGGYHQEGKTGVHAAIFPGQDTVSSLAYTF